MSTLDDLLQTDNAIPLDPVVRWLKNCLATGDVIKVELQTDNSFSGPTVTGLVVCWWKQGQEQPPHVYDWDDELNNSMIDLGISAVDLEQEGRRFGMGLRFALRKVERRYGDGYLNTVLLAFIDESDFGKTGRISEIRRQIHAILPERSGQSYNDCRDAIASAVGGMIKSLREKLNYRSDEIRTVMDIAIAQYLDERFSITQLRTLGWIDEKGHTTR